MLEEAKEFHRIGRKLASKIKDLCAVESVAITTAMIMIGIEVFLYRGKHSFVMSLDPLSLLDGELEARCREAKRALDRAEKDNE